MRLGGRVHRGIVVVCSAVVFKQVGPVIIVLVIQEVVHLRVDLRSALDVDSILVLS